MRRLVTFNQLTLDGFFSDPNGDMSWAKSDWDPELQAFVEGNAKTEGPLLFGRITYEFMASYWPTPVAAENDPVVAARMNGRPKIVFSKTLDEAQWNNTAIVSGDAAAAIRALKNEPGDDMTICGSGKLVAYLAAEGLIDEFKFLVNPIALGKGRSLFDGVTERLHLKLTNSRTFGSGKVLLCYEPAA
jgi:dihydrofolate reductase